MRRRDDLIEKICCCPDCRGPLSWEPLNAACQGCGRQFPRRRGKVFFTDSQPSLDRERVFLFSILENRSFGARTLNLIRKIITSEYQPEKHIRQLVAQAGKEKILVDCGSGNRRLTHGAVNIDMADFPEVNLVSDIHRLPLRDGSVDIVVLDTVLEHVEEPRQCVNEALRVLKRGGRVACVTPFIFPYHPFPKHLWNFSEDGIRFLFKDFSSVNIRMDMGPTSALINCISEYVALAPKGRNVMSYALFKALVLTFLFPLKYLDRLWYKTDKSRRIAMCLYTEAEK